MKLEEGLNIKMSGDITDVIHHLDSGETEVVKGHNIVVTSFTKLVMALLSGAQNYKGASYWAVGSGADSWDDNPVSPIVSETKLTTEIGRKSIPSTAFSFLDDTDEVSSVPTNRLQIHLVFDSSECNGVWREFGIFGGDATSTKNSGIMLDKRHHSVITKTVDMVIERTIVFTLNLS